MHVNPFAGCTTCQQKFSSRDTFVRHIREAHGGMDFYCADCGQSLHTKAEHEAHALQVHNYTFCRKCRAMHPRDTAHCCRPLALAFSCELQDCRGQLFAQPFLFTEHLSGAHGVVEFDRVKAIMGQSCCEVPPPSEETPPARSLLDATQSRLQELKHYVEMVQAGALDSPRSVRGSLHTDGRGRAASSAPKRRRPASTLYAKTKLMHLVLEANERDRPQEGEYELLMCRYKDNKRFIKSIKYEELLLKALALTEALQSGKSVFTVSRYGKPVRSPAFYGLGGFREVLKVVLALAPEKDGAFDHLIEKQWRVHTYSTINNRLYEHKRHSNYMLNKRLRLFCENCQTQFRFFDEFIRHYRACLHSCLATLEQFKCPICLGGFQNYFAMIQHLEIEHFIV